MKQPTDFPPYELVQRFMYEAGFDIPDPDTERAVPQVKFMKLVASSIRYGMDQELDACCEWLEQQRQRSAPTPDLPFALRAARRTPKPPSLKELALEALMTADGPDHPTPMLYLRPDAASIIRRALESIPDQTSNSDSNG